MGCDATICRFRSELMGIVSNYGLGIRRYDLPVSVRAYGDSVKSSGRDLTIRVAGFGQSYRGLYKILWAGSDDTIVFFRSELLGTE